MILFKTVGFILRLVGGIITALLLSGIVIGLIWIFNRDLYNQILPFLKNFEFILDWFLLGVKKIGEVVPKAGG